MASKKYSLLPIEVIEKAVAGEAEAMDTVLRHYAGYIKYLSMYRGHFNSDIEDRLKEKLMKAVLQFQFDR
ncbi:MAG: helix-turn-helix domain-containing protein [Anaerotignum sp.]|nr:helix-turn-helix domain-containing protein [Anaerotignum sp.]